MRRRRDNGLYISNVMSPLGTKRQKHLHIIISSISQRDLFCHCVDSAPVSLCFLPGAHMSRRVLQYPRRQRPLQKHAMPKTANSSWRSDGVSCGGCGDTCRWPESLKEERSQKKPRPPLNSPSFCFVGIRDLRAKERPHVALSCSIFLPVLSIHNSDKHRKACICSDAVHAFVLEMDSR